MRLNKYLSDAGVCSRRAADRMMEEGRVTVDGKTAEPGTQVQGTEEICVDGVPVKKDIQKVLILLNKPRGVVCTSDRRWGDTIVEDLIDLPLRLYSIGRLDKESEGLLLMTNQGDLFNKIMKAGNHHEKEYIVQVDHPLSPGFLKKMSSGVYLQELGRRTRPCKVERIDNNTFRIILTQGLNRQIRRMCETFDYHVTSLKRVRIMNITLGDLSEGAWKEVTGEEMEQLMVLLQTSANNTEHRYMKVRSAEQSRGKQNAGSEPGVRRDDDREKKHDKKRI